MRFRAAALAGWERFTPDSVGPNVDGMLRYLGVGPRQFGLYPLKPLARMNWEFFAVVKGRCAPLGRNDAPPLASRMLWVTAPGSAHTWAGDGPRTVHVAVFHFGSVPAALEAVVREHDQIALKLTPAECARLEALARQLQPEYHQPNHLSNLVFQSALLELTLLALRKLPQAKVPLIDGGAERIVENATLWYGEHLRANPTITEVAREVHVSPSTLRRLFRRVLKEQPARVFGRIQVERGMRLMTETNLKLDTVAEECGFTCTSDFCRAFKALTKVTPTVWRQTILAPPRAAGNGSASASGRNHEAAGARIPGQNGVPRT
jgi:AraC-like DNA-binding protein